MTKNPEQERCRLQEALGIEAWCSRNKCIYWRLLDSQDNDMSSVQGCGLQHYGVINGLDEATGNWLLSMKKRLENTTPEYGKARITFRRREEK